MSSYSLPVSNLLTLGRPEIRGKNDDYTSHGIGPDDVPELIRLLLDYDLARGELETPEVHAQIHAWRALGQLRAEAAIEPLLDVLAWNGDSDDWSDWVGEEVPEVLSRFGPRILPAVVTRLERRRPRQKAVTDYASVLEAIAKRHPDTRDEVIGHLSRILETAAVNEDGVNGWVIADLMHLKAVEAWPAIEKAFATGNVDETIVGDAADVKYELGLGPKPPPRAGRFAFPGPFHTGPNAKERFNERMRIRKAEKKKRKLERKRK